MQSNPYALEELHILLSGSDNDLHDGLETTPSFGPLEDDRTFVVEFDPAEGSGRDLTQFRVHLAYDDRHAPGQPRLFQLVRDEDETGISGTGVVAHGIQFPDGAVAFRWCVQASSTVVWDAPDGIEKTELIHGHGGKTRIVWL